jgi:predicted MFS family arabinose efflux permease
LAPKHIEKRFSTEKRYLQVMTFIRILLLLSLFFLVGPIYSLIFFLIYNNYTSLTSPVLGPFSQFFYKKELRTTISSIDSTIGSIALVIFFPVAGYLVDKIGPTYAVVLSAIPFLLELLVISMIKQKERLVH